MAHNRMAAAFESTGNYRGALEQYKNARRSQKETGIRFNYFSRTTDVTYSLKIVEMLQKLGQTEQALVALREALEARRAATEIDQANPWTKGEHAEIFYRAGKIFAAAGRYPEALAAYREAESYWSADMAVNYVSERSLGKLYLAMGDLFAGIRPDSNEVRSKDPGRWRDAWESYQGSAGAYFGPVTRNLADASDLEKLRLAQERIRLIGKN